MSLSQLVNFLEKIFREERPISEFEQELNRLKEICPHTKPYFCFTILTDDNGREYRRGYCMKCLTGLRDYNIKKVF